MFIANLSIYKKLSQGRSAVFAKRIAPLIGDEDYLLDFGCGNMYTAQLLVKMKPGVKILGIDVVRDQNLIDLSDQPGLSFELSGTNQIDQPDKKFDGVIALAALHHTPDPEFFLSELKRVVKPNGYLILVEEMAINWLDKIYISSQDYILNNLKSGIPVPLNFRYLHEYLNEFKKQNLRIEVQSSVRLIHTMMHHYIFKLRVGD